MFIKILLKYILGYVRITVEGYYIERFINICTTSKILIWNLKREKGVRLYLNIGIKDFFEAVKIAKKLKCKVKIIQKRGIPFLSIIFLFVPISSSIIFSNFVVPICIASSFV
jgi:similar to stage IV sporulation protein